MKYSDTQKLILNSSNNKNFSIKYDLRIDISKIFQQVFKKSDIRIQMILSSY